MRGGFVVGAALVCAVGCGGGTPLRDAAGPVHHFPSRAELERIGRTPAVPLNEAPAVSVESWELQPAPPTDAAWSELLTEATRGLGATRSAALDCAAAELARFYMAHGALPDQRLRRFISGSCGGTVPEPAVFVSGGDADPAASDAQIVQEWRARLVPTLREPLASGGARGMGFAALRSGRTVMVALTWAKAEAELDGWPLPLDANRRVRLSGSLSVQAASITAMINQGAYGVADCAIDPSERLPRFSVECALAPDDRAAWLEIDVQEPGRLLAKRVVEVLVQDGPDAARVYQTDPMARHVPSKNAAELRSAFAAIVNEVRAAAKLSPLGLASKQSFQNDVLAPHYFHAALSDDSATMDQIALGLLAGWDVRGGMIRDGGVLTELLWGTSDAGAMVSYLLDHPLGRQVLLAPEARQLAVGGLVGDKATGLGVIATTYQFFDSRSLAADRARVVKTLARARQERRLPAQRPLDARELTAQATSVRTEHRNPGDALQLAADRTSMALGQPVMAYLMASSTLDRLEFPEALLSAPNPAVAVEVAHYLAPGGAWGQYAILILAVDAVGAPRSMAARSTSARRF